MRVIAVIITFHPELTALQKMICSLKKQHINAVVVDNSPNQVLLDLPIPKDNIIYNSQNLGIAKAQNLGIENALNQGADFICFFDQDSKIPENFYSDMIYGKDPQVNSVFCPVVIDEKTGQELPNFKLSKFGLGQKSYSRGLESNLSVDLAISSGSVATANVFKIAGLMDDKLFIDLVDFEWCFRCIKYSIPIICIPTVELLHSIGDGKSKVPLGGSIHSPFRTYYKNRNPFYLLSKSHIPFLYSFKLILSSNIQLFLSVVFGKNKWQHFISGCKGIHDGLTFLIKKQKG
ncbi:glycosyltransferase family 2 protein [Psychromonas aquimarina]|uniref:glycosyltransferase family 2 protein n=1 Tax=Psychromonas aquimarina TaxID=444919 RepID=UPI000410262B|nr:glycosyltransferase family 2 protein [Psychromonas aquimarina]